MGDTVRDTLDRLERELTAKIDQLRDALAPLEKELAEARAARAAINRGWGAKALSFQGASESAPASRDSPSPYRHLTMKELAVKALEERFPDGALAHELIEFFASEWGRRDILRESFSPQLSRLKREGKVVLKGKRWYLAGKDPVREPSELPVPPNPAQA